SGNAIAVWCQDDGNGTYSIYANTYTAGVGWGTPQHIENNTEDAFDSHIVFDMNGNAIASWYQYDSTASIGGITYASIYANTYTAGSGWGGAQLLENNSGSASSPQIVFDASGNAIAVWEQWDNDSTRSIYANTYTTTAGWGTATPIEANTGDAWSFGVVINNTSGNAIAVWCQLDNNGISSIYANIYATGVGWETPTLIEDNVGSAVAPYIVSDANGNALVVWYQYDNTNSSIYSNTYTATVGWGTATLIENDNASSLQAASDPNGRVIILWEHFGDNYNSDIYAKELK
ncbi:MAG: hypothetical protein HY754_14895, partial [Nitrospirae bacterium]|nr:hypothetical protein [Nitrospirota bacterium]